MTYIYKNKKTGKIIKRDIPLSGSKAKDFILISWIRNMMMKTANIIKK